MKEPARLADTLAGPPAPREALAAKDMPRPSLAGESAAESTRTLLSSAPSDERELAPSDPEERRLSHDLDFGEAERPRRTGSAVSGTRRAVLLLIVLLVLLGIIAVVFEPQMIAAIPALKSVYAQLGL